jgi:NTP pyrophosphatase (non-canonical NTP hydrolase)
MNTVGKKAILSVDGKPVWDVELKDYKTLLYQQVCERYGTDAQLTVAIEELSELTKEICKSKRYMGDIDHLAEELADVEIMCEQLRFIYGFDEKVDRWKENKLKRLEERLKD